jgi:hypothetical protein
VTNLPYAQNLCIVYDLAKKLGDDTIACAHMMIHHLPEALAGI